MKNKIILGVALALATLSITSCADLDENPKGQLNTSSFFKTQDDVNMSLYALYRKVHDTQPWPNMQYDKWMGDDITTMTASNKEAAREMDTFNPTNTNKGVEDCWKTHYNAIKAANEIIAKVDGANISQANKNVAIGNARFWRAYMFFNLVRVYGPVPLTLTNEIDNYTLHTSSVRDVYNQIVDDLTQAENMLPTDYSVAPQKLNGVNVYATQQATKALLSAVYMAMAGYPLNLSTAYYTLAANKAKEVIDGNGTYGFILNSNWADVYSMGNNYNMETVLGINNSGIASKDWAQVSNLPLYQVPAYTNLFASNAGWGDGLGEIKFWLDYPEGPRKAAVYSPKLTINVQNSLGVTVQKQVDWWSDEITPSNIDRHPIFTIFTVNYDDNTRSWINEPFDYTKKVNASRDFNDRRHQLIRYSEVLLWYAEAAARAGLNLTDAKAALKQVRTRAVTTNPTQVGGIEIDNMTADQLAEAAWAEHGWEIAGHWISTVTRREDLLRLNRLQNVFATRVTRPSYQITASVTMQEPVAVSGTTTWNDQMNYLPYPNSDGQYNLNLRRTSVLE